MRYSITPEGVEFDTLEAPCAGVVDEQNKTVFTSRSNSTTGAPHNLEKGLISLSEVASSSLIRPSRGECQQPLGMPEVEFDERFAVAAYGLARCGSRRSAAPNNACYSAPIGRLRAASTPACQPLCPQSSYSLTETAMVATTPIKVRPPAIIQ
jgi:hypothetical protein